MNLKYTATICYTDKTGIEIMWKPHQFIISPVLFQTKEMAQNWIDEVKEYWETPKMKKKVCFESSTIGTETTHD